ncbi:hypothetical protein [Phocaeicola vulgatus]|nr:hypothetical protein [Phocaeicola vulgatus]MDB0863933.1 hypothetical protein [Phocaeicola vulgatus]MDB0884024.1 hypothetical protein [Phocaeicola vulgatus]MDB0891351.1 hypothetical protein [Phocaeicola vulgatus]MDB0908640.1 hypothetical protein [Phocaeicola vulgatus]
MNEKMNFTSENQMLISFLCILANLIIYCSNPYITPFLCSKYLVVIILGLIVLFYFTLRYVGKIEKDAWSKVIFFCMSIVVIHGCLTFILFCNEDGIDGLKRIGGMVPKYAFLLPICILLKKKYNFFLNFFWCSNILIICLSILLFGLFLAGIHLPSIEFSPDGRPHYFFYIGATNMFVHFGDIYFIRIAGFCDEPGQLALIITYLLVLNEFTYKKNANRIFLSVAAFFTFSAAFFITYPIIVLYWLRIGVLKIGKKIIYGICLLYFLSFVYTKVDVDFQNKVEEAIEILIFNRFEKERDGKFHGDNRSKSIPFQIKAFISSPLIGIYGKDNKVVDKIGDPTIFAQLAYYGLCGVLFYAPFVYLFVKYARRGESLLFVAIGLNFLQRPSLDYMFYLVVLTLIFYHKHYQCQLRNKFIKLRNDGE